MDKPRFLITSDRPALTGWRYFWAKRVTSFRPSVHCAQCLVGSYIREFGKTSPVNQPIEIPDLSTGDILYFCGVATPWKWANNLHLAVRITGRAFDTASVRAYNGDDLIVSGAEAIAFDATAAERDYSQRSSAYLTCRNFQFGAAMRAEGHL